VVIGLLCTEEEGNGGEAILAKGVGVDSMDELLQLNISNDKDKDINIKEIIFNLVNNIVFL
tara:strand:- start:61 stop:243 length:183 start_codon:yes stop_codon:yes gene_type:complete